MLLLSDYAKGTLTPALTSALLEAARAKGIPALVDPKGRDYARYRGATVVTPNRRELETVTGETARDLPAVARLGARLRDELGLDALLVKLSEEGMLLLERGQEPRRITAHAREVFDVTGAGDTVLAALGVATGCGLALFEAAEVANRAAGCAVARVGTAPVHWADLLEGAGGSAATRSSSTARTCRPSRRCCGARTGRSSSRTAASTSCTPGHVRLLTEARRGGDLLVVGLNSDASVRRLKGEGRPILSEADRAQVLGGLDAVDFVVVFDEDTPEAIIRELRPQTLVKGGDYTEATVVGAPFVRSYGGDVVLIPLVEGRSTSSMVARLKGGVLMRAYFDDLAALVSGASLSIGPAVDRAARLVADAALSGRHDVRVRERRQRDAGPALRGRARRALQGRPAGAPGGRAHGRHRDPDGLRERLRLLGDLRAADRGARRSRATWRWGSRRRARARTC